MSRNTGPKHRMCRRVGQPLCGLPNCPALKRPFPPGQHGQRPRRKESEYGKQLLEKQKLRFIYGVTERQFRRYFEEARRGMGRPGDRLLQLLETRLDNAVYRLGFARTLHQARQLVTHGHIELNGAKVDIPSHKVIPGDVVGIREKSRNLDIIKAAVEGSNELPPYYERDAEALKGRLLHIPSREEIPAPVEVELIVEFYSR